MFKRMCVCVCACTCVYVHVIVLDTTVLRSKYFTHLCDFVKTLMSAFGALGRVNFIQEICFARDFQNSTEYL